MITSLEEEKNRCKWEWENEKYLCLSSVWELGINKIYRASTYPCKCVGGRMQCHATSLPL